MSITFSGCRTRSAGLISAILNQLKTLDLRPVTRIQVQFDPFQESAKQARDFLFHITSPKISGTNPNCIVKTSIVCDNSEPRIKFSLASGENVLFKGANLTTLNILELYNKHITPLAPPISNPNPETKGIVEKKKKSGRAFRISPGSKRRGVYL